MTIRKLSALASIGKSNDEPDLMKEKRKRFRPGENAPASGVYAAYHLAHAAAHHITVLYAEPFPRCRSCGDGVKFELVLPALYVRAHLLFGNET